MVRLDLDREEALDLIAQWEQWGRLRVLSRDADGQPLAAEMVRKGRRRL